jgi:hypothetical protein
MLEGLYEMARVRPIAQKSDPIAFNTLGNRIVNNSKIIEEAMAAEYVEKIKKSPLAPEAAAIEALSQSYRCTY